MGVAVSAKTGTDSGWFATTDTVTLLAGAWATDRAMRVLRLRCPVLLIIPSFILSFSRFSLFSMSLHELGAVTLALV